MQDENQLMERVKANDQEAFEILVLAYRYKAVVFARSIVADYHMAEDLVQEGFARLYFHRMSYQPVYSFKTYLYTIIRRCCIDYLRRQRRQQTVGLDEIAEQAEVGLTPEEYVQMKMKLELILANFSRLKESYQTALYLFAVEEMRYEEIAEILGISSGQVRVTVFRARKKLRGIMEGECWDEE